MREKKKENRVGNPTLVLVYCVVFFDATNELKCIEFRQSTEGENDDGATTSSLGSARWGKGGLIIDFFHSPTKEN